MLIPSFGKNLWRKTEVRSEALTAEVGAAIQKVVKNAGTTAGIAG
jgi:hypothetical protein